MGFVIGSLVESLKLKDIQSNVGSLTREEFKSISVIDESFLNIEVYDKIYRNLNYRDSLIIGLNIIDKNGIIVYVSILM